MLLYALKEVRLKGRLIAVAIEVIIRIAFFWANSYLSRIGTTLVGETGLEPAASWSQTMRATKLRHSPTLTGSASAGEPC